MSTLLQIATIVTPIVLAGGFYFAWRQFDAIRKARMARLVLSLYEVWDSPRLEEARQKLNEIARPEEIKNKIIEATENNSAELYPLIRVGNFYDTVGSLISESYLDKDIAYELMATAFDRYNHLYSAILRDPNFKDYFKCFQELGKIFRNIKADLEKGKVRHT